MCHCKDDGLITGRDRDFPCTSLNGPPVKGPWTSVQWMVSSLSVKLVSAVLWESGTDAVKPVVYQMRLWFRDMIGRIASSGCRYLLLNKLFSKSTDQIPDFIYSGVWYDALWMLWGWGDYGGHCNCYIVQNETWNSSLLAILESIYRCFLSSKNLKKHSMLLEHSYVNATSRNSYISFLIKSMTIENKYSDGSFKPLCELCVYNVSDLQQTLKCCQWK